MSGAEPHMPQLLRDGGGSISSFKKKKYLTAHVDMISERYWTAWVGKGFTDFSVQLLITPTSHSKPGAGSLWPSPCCWTGTSTKPGHWLPWLGLMWAAAQLHSGGPQTPHPSLELEVGVFRSCIEKHVKPSPQKQENWKGNLPWKNFKNKETFHCLHTWLQPRAALVLSACPNFPSLY